jgi:hypothetical protein
MSLQNSMHSSGSLVPEEYLSEARRVTEKLEGLLSKLSSHEISGVPAPSQRPIASDDFITLPASRFVTKMELWGGAHCK